MADSSQRHLARHLQHKTTMTTSCRSKKLDAFSILCLSHGLPAPVPEYRFAPPRRWRFDWAFMEKKIAVEQEGGIWTRGRHTRGAGYVADLEKYNSAARWGWRVFRFTPAQITSGECLALLIDVMVEL